MCNGPIWRANLRSELCVLSAMFHCNDTYHLPACILKESLLPITINIYSTEVKIILLSLGARFYNTAEAHYSQQAGSGLLLGTSHEDRRLVALVSYSKGPIVMEV